MPKAFEERLFTNYQPGSGSKELLIFDLFIKPPQSTTARKARKVSTLRFSLKLILVGYLENLGSDRRIINN
jgi:hypothetical protein